MADDELHSYHKDHWVEIEPDRFARYDRMFRIDPRFAPRLLAPVAVAQGETVLDFGCGPGYVAVELARQVGPTGRVHAVDVNAEFITRAAEVAREAGVAELVTFHHVLDERLPLPDGSIDRIYAKNVLEYVPDLDHTLSELARVLKPGGTLVASDSDFGFVVVEPLSAAEVAELFDAAAPAFREPNVGRKLRGAYRRAGLDQVRAAFDELGIDALVVIGGNGSLSVASLLHNDLGLPIVGVPKTIDNDVVGTDITFGFNTAVQIATDAIDRLHTTAESHDRVMVVEVMGRHSGWIATHAGIAGGAITGMNAAGLSFAVHQHFPAVFDLEGEPVGLAGEQVLREVLGMTDDELATAIVDGIID